MESWPFEENEEQQYLNNGSYAQELRTVADERGLGTRNPRVPRQPFVSHSLLSSITTSRERSLHQSRPLPAEKSSLRNRQRMPQMS